MQQSLRTNIVLSQRDRISSLILQPSFVSSLRDLFQIGFRSTDILSLTGRVFVVITITPFPAGSEPNGKYCMNVNLCICIGHNGDLVMDQFNSWLYHLITTAIMFSLLFSTASPNAL